MKKLFTILLAAGMFSMYSCGSGSESTEGTTDSTAAPMEQPAPAEAAPATTDSAAMPDTAAH